MNASPTDAALDEAPARAPGRFAAAAADDDERFKVRSPLEILSILRALEAQRELVTVYFGGERDFVVTMVLAVHPELEQLVLDFGAEPRTNVRLMAAGRLLVSSQLAQIRIQFWTSRPETTMFEGLPAFRVCLPSELLRLQRRQYYRVRVPARENLRCHLPATREGDPPVRVRVVNLSCGGAALTDLPADMRITPGARLAPCTLGVDDGEPLTATFEIVRVAEVPHASGPASRLAGIQFIDLAASDRARIQRTINRLERDDIARTHVAA